MDSMRGSTGSNIRHNYLRVLERVSFAASTAGRKPDEIRLVVVSKGQPIQKIQAVIDAGAKELGENYLEEAIPKLAMFEDHPALIWHMIGHVQSRKALGVCQHFDYVHSLDSLKLARRMSQLSGEISSKLSYLIELNVSGEDTKFGFPAWEDDQWAQLLPELTEIVSQLHLPIRGVMGIAPYAPEPESARPYFKRLYRLREYLESQIPEGNWSELSMGMSGDFEIAIQEGATIVRLGEAILGKRV
jgi:PLP dependent protein